MTTITSLPEELISIILSYKDITIEDIINFRCVCKQFRYAASYPKYMENKFSQRWPSLKEHYDIMSKTFKDQDNNYEEFKYCNRRFTIFSFYNDELKSLLTHSPRTGCDLTERYYHEKLFNYIKNSRIKLSLGKFKTLPDRARLMEWIAFNVAQTLQIQKDVTYAYVVESLDNIAREVQNYLKQKHPDHSIFSTSAEFFSYWKNNNIDDNHWNEAEGIQIIDALDEYIFRKLKFRPCEINDTILEFMCIDNVLKSRYGQEVIILIIYHSVARRLGLRSDIVAFGERLELSYCIHWKSRYGTINPANERCFSVMFNKFPDCRVNKSAYQKRSQNLYRNDFLPCNRLGRISPCELRDRILLRFADLTYHYNNISQIKERKKIYLFKTSSFEVCMHYTHSIN
ncbi:uncharacterized protein LOC114933645 [Nylanderia fulva]|uniref:uncharacterized protein LOC114933645 n=2 Tax=Nylanderia fulva TaxID=613905 RepID=UPI0010FBBAE7|nr:uncharacterized protein LOC114933645 [Nylanderia fulva]